MICFRLLYLVPFLAALLISSSTAGPPNIIFILADDWGIGDIGAYGGERCKIDTPHMDELAETGMRFLDAHSSSSVCTPTRYGVLTGRYNWRSRLKQGVLGGFSQPLMDPIRETVPSFLKKRGFHTGMVGKWHLGMEFPTTDGRPASSKATSPDELATQCNVDWNGQIKGGPNAVGFDYFWGISASLDMPPYIWIENDRFVGECTTIKAFHRPGPAEATFEDIDVLPTIAEKAVHYINQRAAAKQPFFLYVALNSPHTPISPSTSWQGKSELGPYGDFVMETDWAVGQIVNSVDQSGIGENTLIIVTADNGCSPAAKQGIKGGLLQFKTGTNPPTDPSKHYPSDIYRGHKADIYEGGHRVPFIARWKGRVAPASLCPSTVCLVDLFATCADIVGTELPETMGEDSVSFLPLLDSNTAPHAHEAVVHHSINGSFAIRRGKWKLALCPGSGGWSRPKPRQAEKEGLPQMQLYDLEADPAETKNLIAQHPELAEELVALLQSYVDRGRSTSGPPRTNEGETPIRKKL